MSNRPATLLYQASNTTNSIAGHCASCCNARGQHVHGRVLDVVRYEGNHLCGVVFVSVLGECVLNVMTTSILQWLVVQNTSQIVLRVRDLHVTTISQTTCPAPRNSPPETLSVASRRGPNDVGGVTLTLNASAPPPSIPLDRQSISGYRPPASTAT